MARPVAQAGATLHFVDDRFETMHHIVEHAPDLLDRWVRCTVSSLHGWVGCSPQQLSGLVSLNMTRCLLCPHLPLQVAAGLG